MKSKFYGLLVVLALSPSLSLSEDKAVKTIVLTKDNTLVLNSEVDGTNVAPLIIKARVLDKTGLAAKVGIKNHKPIYLFLNTPGGDVQAGLELIEALNGLDRPVNTVVLFAASMGWQITQALGERYILNNGVLMSHRASGRVEASFGGKAPSQMDSRMSIWLQRTLEMDKITVKRTKGKQTLESYQNAYDNELWITGTQSVEKGYADNIVKVKCDESLDGTTTHEESFMGIGVSYETDNCPINPSPMNIKVKLPVIEKDKGPITANSSLTMELTQFLGVNGGFGPACLYANTNNVCAADPGLTLDKVRSIVDDFKDVKTNKKNHVIRMHF